jgi:hypothetical protein
MSFPVDILNTVGSFIGDGGNHMVFRANQRGIYRISMRRNQCDYFGKGCRWVTDYAVFMAQKKKDIVDRNKYGGNRSTVDYDWTDEYFRMKF